MKNPVYRNIMLILIVLMNTVTLIAAQEIPADFDHDNTNYLLSDAHLKVACSACHIKDIYKGLSSSCEGCHSLASQIATSSKPPGHIDSNNNCDNCHTEVKWAGARIDHNSLLGQCHECHNNVAAIGKPADHTRTEDSCDSCHTTQSWLISKFDHSFVSGNCFSCHNNTTAAGKSENHTKSSNQCDECHNIGSWKSKGFSHDGIKNGCLNCHSETKRGSSHPKGDQCEVCHKPGAPWKGSRFNHGTTSKNCDVCHNKNSRTEHFVSPVLLCDDCHRSTASWRTNVRFTHSVSDYQEHSVGVPCKSCHISNSQSITWRFSGFRPKCAGCHATNYVQRAHPKNQAGSSYSVAELADCTRSCHISNSSGRRVNDSRRNGGYHSATRGRGITAP